MRQSLFAKEPEDHLDPQIILASGDAAGVQKSLQIGRRRIGRIQLGEWRGDEIDRAQEVTVFEAKYALGRRFTFRRPLLLLMGVPILSSTK